MDVVAFGACQHIVGKAEIPQRSQSFLRQRHAKGPLVAPFIAPGVSKMPTPEISTHLQYHMLGDRVMCIYICMYYHV